MSRLDAGALLRRAIERSADAAGIHAVIERSDLTRWASATFTGARHDVTLCLTGAGADRWLAALPDADLVLRGHLVADLKIVDSVRDRAGLAVVIEALTVEDR